MTDRAPSATVGSEPGDHRRAGRKEQTSGRHRTARSHQALRRCHSRRQPDARAGGRDGDRPARTERCRQDHHAAHAARPRHPDRRHSDVRRAALHRARPARPPRRRRARSLQLPPRTSGGQSPPDPRLRGRIAGPAGPRGAGTSGHDRTRAAPCGRLLARHAPAPRPGRRPARRSLGARPRRTRQRPRPQGCALAPSVSCAARPMADAPSSCPVICSPRSHRPSTTS